MTESLSTLRRLFDDPNIRFPAKPRLIEDVSVFRIPDGLGVQFRSQEAPVLIRGREAEGALNYLLSALDGSRSVPDLIEQTPKDVPKKAVFQTLWLMKTKGLLGGEEDAAGPADDGLRRQLLFWGRHLTVTHSAASSTEIQRRLETARIVLIGTGMFGAATYDVLARSGCGAFSVLAWDDDGVVESALKAHPVTPQQFAHLPTTSVDDAGARLRTWIEGADLVVTATRNAPAALFQMLNEICLERHVPCLRATMEGTRIEIGPYVYPYGSACFTCMELRKRSMEEFAVEEQLYQESLAEERPSGETRPMGEAVAFSTLAAGLVSAEVVRILTEIAPPTLIDSVLTVSPLKGTFEVHRFLRVPRCPSCSRSIIFAKVDGQEA
jgi:bacteriocin biosynthesis cyclodehydratase domain-containing protein